MNVTGLRLQAARRLAALTQAELADSAGLHRVTITRIENGVVTPNARTLRSVAKALGVAPADLLTPTPTSHMIDTLVGAVSGNGQTQDRASRRAPKPVGARSS